LDAPEVLVGEKSFKKMDIKMAASNVTIGAAAKIKVTSASIDIKGPKTTIAGTSIAEIKAALVKLG